MKIKNIDIIFRLLFLGVSFMAYTIFSSSLKAKHLILGFAFFSCNVFTSKPLVLMTLKYVIIFVCLFILALHFCFLLLLINVCTQPISVLSRARHEPRDVLLSSVLVKYLYTSFANLISVMYRYCFFTFFFFFR